MNLMKTEALTALIKRIGSQRVAFDKSVQVAAVEVIGQSIVHRNITPAIQLYDVIGAHLKPALAAYLEKFGNIAYSKAEKKFVFFDAEKVLGKKLEWTEEYSAEVAATVWHTVKKEQPTKTTHDVYEEVGALFSRLAKFAKKGGELKHGDLLKALQTTYNRWSAEQMEKDGDEVKTGPSATPATQEKLEELAQKFGGQPALATGTNG